METEKKEINIQQAVELAATDGAFYGEFFFPKTFRMHSPEYMREMWEALDAPFSHHVGIQVFRGGAKTTLLRAFGSKRIAYGMSNTIVFIGKSQDHAKRSVSWLMRQVENNVLWTQTFGISKGKKWTPEECEIIHKVLEYPINVLAIGITGSVRGINLDDYRPDLIVLDDVLDEENAGTVQQRKKVNELIFGAVDNSLAPPSEKPQTKLVMLQTPLDRDDASELVQNDPEWHPLKFSCFDENGHSRWVERWTTKELIAKKESAIRRNMLSVWMREMECKVIDDESRYFNVAWLKEWVVAPEHLTIAIGIDPSPPKDEEPQNRKKKGPDPEVLSAVGIINVQGVTRKYILEQVIINDPNPEVTVVELARLIRKWHPIVIGVETVAYQKTLKWYIEKAMKDKRLPRVAIESIDDKRAKVKKIRQFYTDACDNSELYIHGSMKTFKDQFQDYPEVSYDDAIESPIMGFAVLEPFEGMTVNGEYEDVEVDESNIESLDNWRAAP